MEDQVIVTSTEDTFFNNQLLIARGLGAYFEDSSLQAAGNVGLFNTPNSLIRTDIASIELGRNARLRSYNEYREYCSYPKVTQFNQISGDPQIQEALREVYKDDIDKVEKLKESSATQTGPFWLQNGHEASICLEYVWHIPAHIWISWNISTKSNGRYFVDLEKVEAVYYSQ